MAGERDLFLALIVLARGRELRTVDRARGQIRAQLPPSREAPGSSSARDRCAQIDSPSTMFSKRPSTGWPPPAGRCPPLRRGANSRCRDARPCRCGRRRSRPPARQRRCSWSTLARHRSRRQWPSPSGANQRSASAWPVQHRLPDALVHLIAARRRCSDPCAATRSRRRHAELPPSPRRSRARCRRPCRASRRERRPRPGRRGRRSASARSRRRARRPPGAGSSRDDRVGFRAPRPRIAGRRRRTRTRPWTCFRRTTSSAAQLERRAEPLEIPGEAVAAELELSCGEHVPRQRLQPPADERQARRAVDPREAWRNRRSSRSGPPVGRRDNRRRHCSRPSAPGGFVAIGTTSPMLSALARYTHAGRRIWPDRCSWSRLPAHRRRHTETQS